VNRCEGLDQWWNMKFLGQLIHLTSITKNNNALEKLFSITFNINSSLHTLDAEKAIREGVLNDELS